MKLLDVPIVDGYGVVTLAEWDGWWVQVHPMLYGDRVVLTPKRSPLVYDYGWCYPKGGAAGIAVALWDPGTDGEPSGYVRAIGMRQRRAGEKAAGGK